jgi:hypothetical protein
MPGVSPTISYYTELSFQKYLFNAIHCLHFMKQYRRGGLLNPLKGKKNTCGCYMPHLLTKL